MIPGALSMLYLAFGTLFAYLGSMRRAFRTVFVLILLLAMFLVVTSAGYVGVRAQDDVAKPKEDLFADLPTEGMVEGVVPTATTKVVVLRAANLGSNNDYPEEDLGSSDRYIAEGLYLMLEQQLQYLPQIVGENQAERVRRFGARLRHEGVPHAGDKEIVGRKHARLDEGLKTFAADVLFVLSYVPGEEGAAGLAYRYSAEKGVHAPNEWTFGKIGKPEPDSVVRQLEGVVTALCDGVGVATEHAPIPRLAVSDKALRAFARMTLAFRSGAMTEAWVEYETLTGADPRAGRAAHYAMEMFLALAQEQSNAAESNKYGHMALRAGREALKHVPNDTHIRGRLGWIGALHYGRADFGRKAIEQALKVQPANIDEIERYLTVYEIEDLEKQIAWLESYALPKVKNGRAEAVIALQYFTRGHYAKGMEWYQKALKIAPGEFDTQLSAGLCGFYTAEVLAKARDNDKARIAYADATDALKTALRIDMQEVPYLYDFYVRAATHDYTRLPTQAEDLEELFLVQSVLTALQSSSRTFQWDRLVKDVLPAQKRLLKESVAETTPEDELYILKLMARLRLSFNDQDTDDVVHTLWLIKQSGYRPEIYGGYMNSFAPIVNEYKPQSEEPKEDEPEDG